MNKASFIFFAALLCGWSSPSQTNSSVVPAKWLSVSPPRLRPLFVEAAELNEVQSERDEMPVLPDFPAVLEQRHATTLNALNTGRFDLMNLSSPPGEFDFRTYRLLEENGYLKRSEPKPDNLFARIVTGIFQPEPIRMGKTVVTCSIITAIKRKNPLCLINPMVLTVSW